MVSLPRDPRAARERGDRGRVVQYTNDTGKQIYATLHPTAAESHRCVEVLTALREVGFHSSAPHRVLAGLEQRPQERVVVLAAARRVPLASLVHAGTPTVRLQARREALVAANPRMTTEAGEPKHQPSGPAPHRVRRGAEVAARPHLRVTPRSAADAHHGARRPPAWWAPLGAGAPGS